MKRNVLRRLERLEARLKPDPLLEADEFHFVWIAPFGDGTPIARCHLERECAWSGSIPDWRRPGQLFRYGTVRKRVLTGQDDGVDAGDHSAGLPAGQENSK